MEQTDYISTPSSVSLIGVLRGNNISASTATLEVMGYYSQLGVLPVYKASLGFVDQESLQMLDIILGSVAPNFETVWYRVGISEGILAQIKRRTDFTDFWETNSADYTSKLNDLVSALDGKQ